MLKIRVACKAIHLLCLDIPGNALGTEFGTVHLPPSVHPFVVGLALGSRSLGYLDLGYCG